MFELTREQLQELRYEALHGDDYAMHFLNDYWDQFEDIPTEEDYAEWAEEGRKNEMLYWIDQFSEQNDYYGDDLFAEYWIEF